MQQALEDRMDELYDLLHYLALYVTWCLIDDWYDRLCKGNGPLNEFLREGLDLGF